MKLDHQRFVFRSDRTDRDLLIGDLPFTNVFAGYGLIVDLGRSLSDKRASCKTTRASSAMISLDEASSGLMSISLIRAAQSRAG